MLRARVFAGLLATVVMGALIVTAPASARGTEAQQRQVKESHERVLAYWTPERMRNAIPRDLGVGPQPSHHRPGHAGGPGGGGGGDDGGDTGGAVKGAPWSDASIKGQVGETTGKVFFTLKGTNYVCSGSTVTSLEGDSVVLTAGHCVHDGDNKDTSWATNFTFVPAYEDGGSSCPTTTYGCWTAETLTTTTSWYTSSDFSDDAGFANMRDGGHSSSNLVGVVGSQAISFSNAVVAEAVYAFGYPAAQKYNGRDLIYCAGTARTGVIGGTAGLDCDMTGGSSGGPWLAEFDEISATGTAVSVNSHGFRSLKDVMFGPVFDVFDDGEEAAYNTALGGGEHPLP